ncbi:unnamed protein product [Peniophora sp. CBMAI 1063]|nr:unnamed protein product [Peniophora sp. CBMAI 1063]
MTTEEPIRDELFYFHSVVFQAENRLFKVPRYGLPGDAAVFDSMFANATGGAGSSDENPIRLDADVSATDFRSLLKAAFPPPGATTAVLTLDEWMGVLALAKKWNLESMRDKAVAGSDAEIQKRTVIDKILIAKKYGVSQWLKEGYRALASRGGPITSQERDALGWETYGRLMHVRENCRCLDVDDQDASGVSLPAMRHCTACVSVHRPYCAENKSTAGTDWGRQCSICGCRHIPGCWAVDTSATPPRMKAGGNQNYDLDAAIEEEFLLSKYLG